MTDIAKPADDPSDLLRAAVGGEPQTLKAETAKPETLKPETLKTETSEAETPPGAAEVSAPAESSDAAPVSEAKAEPVAATSAPMPSLAARTKSVAARTGTVATDAFRQSRSHARAAAKLVGRHPTVSAAAAVAIAAGLGFAGGRIGPSSAQTDLATQRWAEAAQALRQSQDDMTRLTGDVRGMRAQLDGLRSQRPEASKLAQTNDRVERSVSDQSARLSKLTEQVERLEKTQRDPTRIAGIVERLDRIERQTQTVAEKVTAPVPPPKPVAAATPPAAEVTQTGSLAPSAPKVADAKGADTRHADHKVAALAKTPEPDPRKTQLDAYVLRDVGDGVALIETQNGRLVEVKPGQTLATGAKVEAIERRGRHWVVVTSKGFIGERW